MLKEFLFQCLCKKDKLNSGLNMTASLTSLAVDKNIKTKENFADNHFHNILRLFVVLPTFSFATRLAMCDYYLQIW